MPDPARAPDEDTVKLGLLMESAHAQQRLAESHLEHWRAAMQELDAVVRAEIRRTLIEELKGLTAESDQAALALRRLKRSAGAHGLLWSGAWTAIVLVLAPLILSRLLPSAAEVAMLRAERERLREEIARFERLGADVQWQRCGAEHRLCVRIDRRAPAYGEHADYYVLEGH